MTFELSELQRNALEHLKRMRDERKAYADLLREGRAMVKQMSVDTGKPHRYFAKIWREAMRAKAENTFCGNYPNKPTLRNINRTIAYLEEMTATELQPIILDDGYACCGLEDHYAEARDNHLEDLDMYRACVEFVK